MATRKEVDLVIRARDQAKGVVNSITDALSDFQGVQKKLQSEAGETDSGLGELGKSFRDLQKALRAGETGVRTGLRGLRGGVTSVRHRCSFEPVGVVVLPPEGFRAYMFSDRFSQKLQQNVSNFSQFSEM